MLDLFQNIPKITDKDLNWQFKFLRDNLFIEKNILSKWVENFIDRDGNIVKKFQTHFHSSFWEFYLFAVLSELSFEVDFSRNRPDFIITSPEKLMIEAVVSNIKMGGRQFTERTHDDYISMLIPPQLASDFYDVLDESIVRHSSAILDKWRKYTNEYSKLTHVTGDEPYVIALSSYDQVNYGREYVYSMMALLFGMYYDPEVDDYIQKTSIKKPGTESDISLGLFNDARYEDISAVLFSCTMTFGKLTSLAKSDSNLGNINHIINIRQISDAPCYRAQHVSPDDPEELSDGLFLFHNPYAKNQLNRNIFEGTNIIQVYTCGDQFRFDGNQPPIFSRFNSIFELPQSYLARIINTFNRI